jgi:phosphonate utilization associated putative membrane protein
VHGGIALTPTLSGFVVAMVLLGALLHASWNVLVKSSTDKALDAALIHLIGSVVALPLVLWVGWPPAHAWPYIGASVVIHIAYYIALTGAYKHGDLGLTYPLMRGVAPLLVALSTFTFFGESLSPVAWVGVLGVSVGVLALGLSAKSLGAGLSTPESARSTTHSTTDSTKLAIAFALSNAVIIAIYTVVDALGARASGNPFQYVLALFVLDGWPFGLVILARRGRQAWPYARQRWPVALGGAVASLGSYGIALWAMTQAPVAAVAALRETSVLFAAVLGWWLLKETLTPQRVVGTVGIVLGVVALRFG